MKFSKQMLVRMVPEWKDQYVRYEELKNLIRQAGTSAEEHPPPETISDTVLKFEAIIEEDVRRVDDFYTVEIKKLVDEGHKLAEEKKHDRLTLLNFRERIMRLFDYATVNKVAFGKILKKWQRWLGEAGGAGVNVNVLAWASKVDNARFQDTTEGMNVLNVLGSMLEKKRPMVRRPSDFSHYEETDKRVLLDTVEFSDLLPGRIHRLWLSLTMDAFSRTLKIPLIIARGMLSGPILGITAAVHGNELNGIPLIHRLVKELDVDSLHGIVVFVPVVNNPGFMRCTRTFSDGQDLNRLFPGKPDGDSGNQYCYQFMHKIIKKLDFLIDLHTASHGRVNSLYVRANLLEPMARRMALLQNPQIVVHNSSPDGSLRGAAAKLQIPAITVEIGNPLVFQRRYIRHALVGVYNIMVYLNMLSVEASNEPPDVDPVVCGRSSWSYADVGGLMVVHPEVNTWVRKGDKIATVHDVFGDHVRDYFAPEDGIVIGKNVNPVVQAGDRIIHLGVVTNTLKANQHDGHR